MRRKFIGGNWKMNKTPDQAKEFVISFVEKIKTIEGNSVDIALFPPFLALSVVKEYSGESRLIVGAQNMHYKDSGAFTGEISPVMLNSVGVNWVILGHSERRHIFRESNELINLKVKAALEHNFHVILCVGETEEERLTSKHYDVIKEQLESDLADIDAKGINNIVVAYEPVWAIGTGKTATPEDAEEMHRYIRRLFEGMYNSDIADKVRIIYGGSVKPANAKSLLVKEDIDGALVGGASLNPQSFFEIINSVID